MKQNYIKPMIVIERFGLTQSVATGCGAAASNTLGNPTQWSKSSCAWEVGGLLIFLDTMNVCADFKVKEDEEVFGACYNNPEGSMIFSSF